MMDRPCLLSLLVAAAFASSAQATDIQVPGDHATIQAAIDAATDGDVVCVDPGTYVENLDLKGKAITLRSTGGTAVTTLSPLDDRVPVIQCVSGEPSATIIEGFTVTGGNASQGAGIFCQGSSPTIRSNVIRDNYALTEGGGVYVSGGAPLIEDNVIEDNTAANNSNGGGIYAWQSSLAVRNNQLEDNRALGNGGGMSAEFGAPSIEGNVFLRNMNSSTRTSDRGGGLYLADCTAAVVGNEFRRNDSALGGGLFFLRGTLEICDNVFDFNDSRNEDGIYGTGAEVLIEDNTFQAHRNLGLYLINNVSVIVRGNLFQGNVGTGARIRGGRDHRGQHLPREPRPGLVSHGRRGVAGSQRLRLQLHPERRWGRGRARRLLERNLDRRELVSEQLRRRKGGAASAWWARARGFRDNTFVGNQSGDRGGALFQNTFSGSFTINGCTFHDNDAVVGEPAFWVRSGGTVAVVNSIVWDTVDRPLIRMWDGILSISHSTIRGGAASIQLTNATFVPGAGMIALDPQFVDAAGGDLTLQSTSPCIDAARSSGTSFLVDGAGRSRYVDGDLDGSALSDLGALEYHPATLAFTGVPAVGAAHQGSRPWAWRAWTATSGWAHPRPPSGRHPSASCSSIGPGQRPVRDRCDAERGQRYVPPLHPGTDLRGAGPGDRPGDLRRSVDRPGSVQRAVTAHGPRFRGAAFFTYRSNHVSCSQSTCSMLSIAR